MWPADCSLPIPALKVERKLQVLQSNSQILVCDPSTKGAFLSEKGPTNAKAFLLMYLSSLFHMQL